MNVRNEGGRAHGQLVNKLIITLLIAKIVNREPPSKMSTEEHSFMKIAN
jgi:hypothetical protein